MARPSFLARVRGRTARALRSARLRMGQPSRAPIRTHFHRAATLPATGGAEFDASRAWDALVRQCAFGSRAAGADGREIVEAWLLEQLSTVADEVGVQRWEQRIYRGPGAGRRIPMSNLFARIEGTEPGPPLMFATHWDTRPVADQDPDPSKRHLPVPGANDGASGVAILSETARALAASRPRRAVILACFDGEDLGEYYYGSTLFGRWVRRSQARRWRPGDAVVIDMVGKANLRCVTESHSTRLAPELWARVMAAGESAGLGRHFGGIVRAIHDDHIALNRAGIPAVLLIDYTYPQWHTTHDTVEQCSAESLKVVGDVLLRLARER